MQSKISHKQLIIVQMAFIYTKCHMHVYMPVAVYAHAHKYTHAHTCASTRAYRFIVLY